jgi:VWFA-related protein
MTTSRTRCLRPAVASALALSAVLAGVVGSAAAQSRERHLYVSALDKTSGAPVDALTPADVLVREDGVSREVLRVERATEPMQIALIVDNSAATTSHLTDLRNGLLRFVKEIGPRHELSLVTHGDGPRLVASFSTDRAEVEAAINRLFPQPNSGAYLMDAIQETTRGFVKRESPRPVIVVVSTEAVEFSNISYQPVLDGLQEAHAQLHVLLLVDRDPDTSQEEQYRAIVIDRGTRETGGRRDNLLSSMALPEALSALAAELNAQWRVTYARPESLIPPKTTTVASARPALEIRGVAARTAP